MKRIFQPFLAILAFVLVSLIPQKANASHAAGGEIIYSWVSDSTYKVTFKFYRDCSGIAEPASVSLCYRNDCNSLGGSINLPKTGLAGGNGDEVIVPCPTSPTTCNGGVYPGYREWHYSANVTLPSRCAFWHFWVYISARNSSANFTTAGNFFVEATLNNVVAQGNSSPYFTVKPVPYVCLNQPYTYNNGVFDPNNDSLRFEMIMPREQNGCFMPQNATNMTFNGTTPAYNLANNPLQTNNSFYLDPNTGQMSFTPTALGSYTVTLLVREYRAGVLIGTVMRDIQIIVILCSNPQPSLLPVTTSFIGITPQNGRLESCAGQPMYFCLDMISPNANAFLAVQDNVSFVAPTATMTYTGIGTDSVRGCFSWFPTAFDTGQRVLTFTVRDSNCINGGIPVSQTFSVILYVYPITQILNDTTICPGDSVNLEAVGGGNFTWTVLPGGSPLSTLSCTSCKMPWAKPSVTTQYVVTSNLSSICNRNKDTVTITVPQLPQFSAGPDTVVCINNSYPININLVPSPGTNYTVKWSPSTYLSNDTSVSPTVILPQNDITYVVTVTPSGLAKCAGKDTLNITVLQGFDLLTGQTAICKGSSININANGDPRYTYTWTPAVGVANTSVLSTTITPDTSRTYTITASRPACPDSVRSFYVEVEPIPVVFAGIDQTLCVGDTVHMDFASATPAYANYIYNWTPGGSLDVPSSLNPIFTASLTETLTLTVRTPLANCSASDAVTYLVQPGDFMDVSSDTSICPGDTAQLHVTGTYASMSWRNTIDISDTLSTDPFVYPITTTTYHVKSRDLENCIDTGFVTVFVKPRALVSLPDSVRLFPGDSYLANPGGNGMYFTWYPPNGVSNVNASNPILQPSVNTRYYVNVRTEFGCTATDSMDVLVNPDSYINVPNAFTPGSSPNGILKVLHSGKATLNSFRIYNRWGTKVFETSDINQGWDGTFGGEPQQMGVYIYMLEATTFQGVPIKKNGDITLIR